NPAAGGSGERFREGKWRRERGSNPRDGSPPTHFPGVRLLPLGHLSVGAGIAKRTARRKRADASQGLHPGRGVVYTEGRLPKGASMANQTETILRTLHEWIDTGRLNPGDEIEEAALVQHFGVSRTPVREALMQIEATGLVKRLPRKGAVVFKPTLPEFLAILEVHATLEGQAAGLAARRLSVSGAQALEAATAACEAHFATLGEAEPDAYYQLNLRFHGTVAESAGNAFLLDMIKTNARKLMAYYRARYRYAG